MKREPAALISFISGVLAILNSLSFFQQSSFYFAACHLLAFRSLTTLAAAFLLFDRERKIYWER